jgi:2-polyprenyl-6-hydroxyphenyl methylase/3-demethylubiquinone-9 3-methyltransferase
MNKNLEIGTEYWERLIDNITPSFRAWIKEEKSEILKIIKKDSVVLDIGCGTGRSIREIAGLAKEVVGVDFNKSILRETKKNLSNLSNVKLFCENAKKLHFLDNVFDYVICVGNTFGNFGEDKIKIIKEVKRVLKKGGVFLVSVYSEKALPERLKIYNKFGMNIKRIEERGKILTKEGIVTEQFSRSDLRGIFKRSGLTLRIKTLSSISYLCKARK